VDGRKVKQDGTHGGVLGQLIRGHRRGHVLGGLAGDVEGRVHLVFEADLYRARQNHADAQAVAGASRTVAFVGLSEANMVASVSLAIGEYEKANDAMALDE
jgi:hypothetical protein